MDLKENTTTGLLVGLDILPRSADCVAGTEAPYTGRLCERHAEGIFARALRGEATEEDATRAFASIPSRHDVWRRVTSDWLAGMVVTGVL